MSAGVRAENNLDSSSEVFQEWAHSGAPFFHYSVSAETPMAQICARMRSFDVDFMPQVARVTPLCSEALEHEGRICDLFVIQGLSLFYSVYR